jgi:hypothetical protein
MNRVIVVLVLVCIVLFCTFRASNISVCLLSLGPWLLARNQDTSFSLCHLWTNWSRSMSVVSILQNTRTVSPVCPYFFRLLYELSFDPEPVPDVDYSP